MDTRTRNFADDRALETFMSAPTERVIRLAREIEGDIAILGAAGKVGVTLAEMAVRAVREAGLATKVYGVSRFSDPADRGKLEAAGVQTIACDLLDRAAVEALPDAADVLFLAGRKFGTIGAKDLTWATNAIAPANAAERYAGSRIVAFSTGCVYALETAATGGSTELDDPAPIGEYAQSALARERVFEHYSRAKGTPVCLFRLNYAIDLRYGVLRDIADRVFAGRPVDLSVGSFNCIWQGDVIERALLSLGHCSTPPLALNVTGPETISVAWAAREFGLRFGKEPRFSGEERCDSRGYLSNAAASFALFGYPSVTLAEMIDMTADWIASGGSSLGKPTHFEATDGKF